jgi:hypothetical protein
MSKLEDLITIDEAAKRAHLHRKTMQAFAAAKGLLVPWGGSHQHPRHRVPWSKIEAALAVSGHAAPPKRQRRMARPTQVCEDVTC